MTASDLKLRFHADRDRLLAEAHARPSTPLAAPALATRIVSMSGEAGIESDRRHMAALCRKLAAPEPGEGARWCLLEAGAWSLRWERHTEASTWTVFRPGVQPDVENFGVTALDLLPRDWLAELPGEILVAAHAAIVAERPPHFPFAPDELVAARIGAGPIQVFSDFRAGPDSFTRFVMVAGEAGGAVVGRTLQQLFEVETYRLMALLTYPLALQNAAVLTKLEADIDSAAAQVVNENGVESDRSLVNTLAALAGQAERLAGQTNFRVAASRAYYGLVGARIASWNEQAVDGRPTLGEFMERRLAPAMRTCVSVAERQQGAIERIARTVQILNTRVEVASEIVNVNLLASMDRRSELQLRLQETVEGLSIVAVSYYALSLLKVGFDGLSEVAPWLNPTIATAIAVPVVLYVVWRFLRRVRKNVLSH
ncbi:MAG: DUF3422 domain-containing protein [Hyphomonadaceae bacterium]|nr:DUF3422 domain-containing protein [Hyphomonadaceae bacterium]